MLGDVNLDVVVRGDDVVPRFGQVEQLVDTVDSVLGGSGGITAAAAARLGVPTSIVAVLGDDPAGRWLASLLRDAGVGCEAVAFDPTRPTGTTVVLARPDDRAILTHAGSIDALRAEDVPPAVLGRARHVHVSGYYLQTALQAGLGPLLAGARAAGATTSLDPNWDPAGTFGAGLCDVLEHLDVLFVNEQEAVGLAGALPAGASARVPTPLGAAAALAAIVPQVVVKLGAAGALVQRGGRAVRRAGQPAAAVNATGAGDNFDAGFLAAELRGMTVEQSLAVACACGAASTLAPGGTGRQLSWSEAVAASGQEPPGVPAIGDRQRQRP